MCIVYILYLRSVLSIHSIQRYPNYFGNLSVRISLNIEWKKVVWDRGWSLEDTFWSLEARLYRDLNLLTQVCSGPRCLVWWTLSNKYPGMMRICENMSKMICHASLLKCDDVRLKRLSPGNRVCSLCELYAIEDTYHVMMQCPYTQLLRTRMFAELESDPSVRTTLRQNADETMIVCLGKRPQNTSDDVMEKLWCISGKHMSGIYEYVLQQRRGVG